MLLRTYRGEGITRTVPVEIPANARGTVSIMVADATRLSQLEARELQMQPLQTRGLPQMMRVLNSARKNNRLYVRLLSRDGGAVVKGESLAALPPSVLAVMESDRNGGSFSPLQSALLGEWEIATEHAVTGSRTLTLPLEEVTNVIRVTETQRKSIQPSSRRRVSAARGREKRPERYA